MDFESRIILIYCICDDCIKAQNYIDDPQCRMNSAEIMTVAIIGALFFYGNFRKTRLVLHRYFPQKILSESQLNRRWHAIEEEIWLTVLSLLASVNKSLQIPSSYYAVDSFPLPVCQRGRSYCCKLYKGKKFLGYCKSKRLHYYGLKVHLIVNEFGTICAFTITPASENDVKALENWQVPLPEGSILLGDKAYTFYELESLLKEQEGIELLPLRKKILSVSTTL